MESLELFPDSERTLLKRRHIHSLARVAFVKSGPCWMGVNAAPPPPPSCSRGRPLHGRVHISGEDGPAIGLVCFTPRLSNWTPGRPFNRSCQSRHRGDGAGGGQRAKRGNRKGLLSRRGQHTIHREKKSGFTVGNGDGPVARFFSFWFFFAIGTTAARKQTLLLCVTEGGGGAGGSFHCVVTFKCYFPANSFSKLSLLFSCSFPM